MLRNKLLIQNVPNFLSPWLTVPPGGSLFYHLIRLKASLSCRAIFSHAGGRYVIKYTYELYTYVITLHHFQSPLFTWLLAGAPEKISLMHPYIPLLHLLPPQLEWCSCDVCEILPLPSQTFSNSVFLVLGVSAYNLLSDPLSYHSSPWSLSSSHIILFVCP